MQRHLFKHIKEAVKNPDNYFKKKPDACGKEGLSALQKCVAAIRILAYGVQQMPLTSTCVLASQLLKNLCGISVGLCVEVFGDYYLRAPNAADVAKLL
jgi:hypothetical protein